MMLARRAEIETRAREVSVSSMNDSTIMLQGNLYGAIHMSHVLEVSMDSDPAEVAGQGKGNQKR